MFVWADAGDDLEFNLLDSIENRVTRGSQTSHRYTLWPFYKHRPDVRASGVGIDNVGSPGADQALSHASRLHLNFDQTLHTPLMVTDPFYALNNILTSAAESQNRLLNMTEQSLAQHIRQNSPASMS